MTETINSIEQKNILPNFEHYLQPANFEAIRCVDERPAEHEANGVQIPGGIYGIIDAIKSLAHCSEEEAWKKAKEANIPMDDHIDEHHGARGCGYAKLVEDEPHTVNAPESIPAENRLAQIKKAEGTILTLLGDHKPTHATINEKIGTTMNSNRAMEEELGIFNFDRWATKKFGEMLGFNPKEFADHLTKVYENTVTRLTGIQEFHTLR